MTTPASLRPGHLLQAMWAVIERELIKFSRQYGRLISSLVRPLLWLAVLMAINSVIGAYYYLRVIVVMYMREGREEAEVPPALPLSLQAAVALSAAATLYLGILPQRILDYAVRSAQDLMR